MKINSLKSYVKHNVLSNPNRFKFLFKVHNKYFAFNKNRFNSRKNKINVTNSLLKRTNIIIKGSNNVVTINSLSHLIRCRILISGDNNVININQRCSLNNTSFVIEDSNNIIEVGEYTWIAGKTDLCAIEGTKISIGKNCMFSGNIHLRTGDSHSILNNTSKERINPSQNIIIGDHVWIGSNVSFLKGSKIPSDSIVAYGSIVTKEFDAANSIFAGIPAKQISSNVNWIKERI